jgi:hypothetical protein
MKQQFIMVAALLQLTALTSFSQSISKATNFNSQMRPALQLVLPNDSKTAEETILSKLQETGYKPEKNGGFLNKKNKQEGFYIFNGVELPELSNQKLDLFFKVEPLNNNTVDRSAITLMVSKGYANFVSLENDSSTFMAAEKFLNSFLYKTDVFAVEADIETKKKDVASSEKKWQNLRDKQEEGKKKIAQLEAEVKNWEQEEAAQQKEVNIQRSALKDLEARRSAIRQ